MVTAIITLVVIIVATSIANRYDRKLEKELDENDKLIERELNKWERPVKK